MNLLYLHRPMYDVILTAAGGVLFQRIKIYMQDARLARTLYTYQ